MEISFEGMQPNLTIHIKGLRNVHSRLDEDRTLAVIFSTRWEDHSLLSL